MAGHVRFDTRLQFGIDNLHRVDCTEPRFNPETEKQHKNTNKTIHRVLSILTLSLVLRKYLILCHRVNKSSKESSICTFRHILRHR